MRRLCINIVTGNKYYLVSREKIWFMSLYTGFYLFHRMLCFQFLLCMRCITVMLKLSLTFKIVFLYSPRLSKILHNFFLETTVWKWKRQTFRTYIVGTSIQDWIWPFYKKEKKKSKNTEERKTCSFSSTSAIPGESWLILMEVAAAEITAAKMKMCWDGERMCAARWGAGRGRVGGGGLRQGNDEALRMMEPERWGTEAEW